MPRYRLYENGIITIFQEPLHRVIPDKLNGLKKKKYGIDWKIFREIASAAANQFHNKQSEVVFLTLTFPSYITEFDANKVFSEFVNRFKKYYKLKSYVAIKELHASGIPHFHGLFEYSFMDIRNVNNLWCQCFPSNIDFSNCAVRLPKGENSSCIRSIEGVTRYLAKYVSKSRGVEYEARCFFVSRNVQCRPRELTYEEYLLLINTFESKIYKNDYSSVVIIKNALFPMNYELERKKIESAERLHNYEIRISLLNQQIKETSKLLRNENAHYRTVCDAIDGQVINPLITKPYVRKKKSVEKVKKLVGEKQSDSIGKYAVEISRSF